MAYVATGVWHHYLITRDTAFLKEFFPVVDAAMAFVLALQGDTGEIDWAVDAAGEPMGDALVTGCSSIYKSRSALPTSPGPWDRQGPLVAGQGGAGHRLRPDPSASTVPGPPSHAMPWTGFIR